ncbi:MAG: class I SAM-dependent methyltransferase [Patescibacteria group bacterium]
MMTNTKKNYTAPWKKMADSWKLFTPPWKPSENNIILYKKLLDRAIKGIKSPKVLILGATPEIRDMLADYKNIEVTIADITMEMILAMNELVKKKNFSNEIWIKSDWLKMPLEKDYFDVIFGDYVISQLPKELINTFLSKIKSLLKPTGRFIPRAVFFNEDTALDFDEIIKKFDKIKESDQSITDIASYCFVGKTTTIKKGNYYIFSLPLLKTVRDKYEKKNGKNRWLTALDKALAPYEKEWFFYSLSDTENNLNNYFDIEEKIKEPKGSSLGDTTFTYYLKRK